MNWLQAVLMRLHNEHNLAYLCFDPKKRADIIRHKPTLFSPGLNSNIKVVLVFLIIDVACYKENQIL